MQKSVKKAPRIHERYMTALHSKITMFEKRKIMRFFFLSFVIESVRLAGMSANRIRWAFFVAFFV